MAHPYPAPPNPAAALTPEEWHTWFSVQAGWTRQARQWLYQEAGLAQARSVLEVGCGTGVIAEELVRTSSARVIGLDHDPAMLAFARARYSGVVHVRGDAHALPFPDRSFDIVVCHYLLLWLADPARGVQEMMRVVRPAGCVLACAEPDYGGRIDYPPKLAAMGWLQSESLRLQGAAPEIGRRLGELFVAAGLKTTVGTMAGQWRLPGPPDAWFEAEWAIRERDLAGLLTAGEMRRLRALDRQALVEGKRILYVPTFYALGKR
jgi:ubiquinone/menaquinone biosynthesis C-methylase UbiE